MRSAAMSRSSSWMRWRALSCIARANHGPETGRQSVPLQSRMFEVTFHSQKTYADPFNEVDLDVVFENDEGKTWRVPTFWHGGHSWTVRFKPETAGQFTYRLVCNDRSNAQLN